MANIKLVFGTNLTAILDKEGRGSRIRLATHLKVDPNSVTRWAKCIKLPSIETCGLIADYFKISYSDLFKEESNFGEKINAIKSVMPVLEKIPAELLETLLSIGDNPLAFEHINSYASGLLPEEINKALKDKKKKSS